VTGVRGAHVTNADAAGAAAEAPRDEVDDLIVRTRARGSVTITSGEIFSALPKLEPETDQLKSIFERIQASGFDIIDEVSAQCGWEGWVEQGRPALRP